MQRDICIPLAGEIHHLNGCVHEVTKLGGLVWLG